MTVTTKEPGLLDRYAEQAGQDAVSQLLQLAGLLAGLKVVHVNSTPKGGGVAEILEALVPLMRALGLDASWEVIEGTDDFFACTKSFHNALQGKAVDIPPTLLRAYEDVNAENAERLRPILEAADVVFIHDPQPAPLLYHCPDRRGKWIWRCHIDLSHPYRPVWKYLRRFLLDYDASIFSLDAFVQTMPYPVYPHPAEYRPPKREEPSPRSGDSAQDLGRVRHRHAQAAAGADLSLRPVQGSTRGDSGLPPGQGLRPRSAVGSGGRRRGRRPRRRDGSE